MRDIFTLFLHAIVIIIRLGRPGGLRSVVAESLFEATTSPDSESWSEAGSEFAVNTVYYRSLSMEHPASMSARSILRAYGWMGSRRFAGVLRTFPVRSFRCSEKSERLIAAGLARTD